jgi:hypothetical protein
MPRVKLRSRRADSGVIEQLRGNIAAGIPWRQPEAYNKRESLGYGDLILLVDGLYYAFACDFVRRGTGRSDYDAEAAENLWQELRKDILEGQRKYRPGKKPWACRFDKAK